AHPLGTDNLGRDLLVRGADAVRMAVLPMWSAVLVATLAGFVAATVLLCLDRIVALRYLRQSLRIGFAVCASIPVGIAAFGWSVLSEKAGLLPVMMAVSLLFFVRVFLQTLDLFSHDERLGYWEAHRALGGGIMRRILGYGLKGTWRWR